MQLWKQCPFNQIFYLYLPHPWPMPRHNKNSVYARFITVIFTAPNRLWIWLFRLNGCLLQSLQLNSIGLYRFSPLLRHDFCYRYHLSFIILLIKTGRCTKCETSLFLISFVINESVVSRNSPPAFTHFLKWIKYWPIWPLFQGVLSRISKLCDGWWS